ncbi:MULTISPECIES: hypothetical protein [unclassified Sporosarcina]|uniref:hypothetical protein n=1 Tax=unclassified Sporosarcina TaxID=2647733 RepID=UPI0013040218|nr:MULTISPECIES: hypothetical protein [unclassified Sporosarcina]
MTQDALLEGRGWDVLSIAYKEAGTITMSRDQEAKNEADMGYFPIAEIDKNLK